MNSLSISPAISSFRKLIQWWSEHVGHHQVPVRDPASDINDFMGADAVHHDLIHEVVRRVYRANQCGHLDAAISLDNTFTVLGEIQKTLLNKPGVDVDQMTLLDNIGWCTRQYFSRAEESNRGSTGYEVTESDATAFGNAAVLNRV